MQPIQNTATFMVFQTSLQFWGFYTGFLSVHLFSFQLVRFSATFTSDLLLRYEPSWPVRTSETHRLSVSRVHTKDGDNFPFLRTAYLEHAPSLPVRLFIILRGTVTYSLLNMFYFSFI